MVVSMLSARGNIRTSPLNNIGGGGDGNSSSAFSVVVVVVVIVYPLNKLGFELTQDLERRLCKPEISLWDRIEM